MSPLPTLTTGRASLWALGEDLQRRCFFAPLQDQVKIAPQVVTYCPPETRLGGWVGMRCGAKPMPPVMAR